MQMCLYRPLHKSGTLEIMNAKPAPKRGPGRPPVSDPRRVRLGLRLTRSELRALVAASKRAHRPVAVLARELVMGAIR